MIRDAESRSNNLTNAQCDKFQKDHKEVAVSCWGTGKAQWEVYDQVGYDSPLVGADDVKTTTSELSREAAITAYWQKYHPDWTPPEIWDAETALEYAKKKRLVLQYYSTGRCGVSSSRSIEDIKNDDDNIIQAAKDWKLKYDSDKVEPEETKPVYDKDTILVCKVRDIVSTVRILLKEATDGS